MTDYRSILGLRLVALKCESETFDNIMNSEIQDIIKLNDLDDDSLTSTFDYFANLSDSIDYSSNNRDILFMRIARTFASESKDPRQKVGAVAVRDRQIISHGYNGFPRGIKDDWRLYVKEYKSEMIIHAEMNAIINAMDNGVSLKDSTLYVYGLPACSSCVTHLIQSGVKRIVMCDTTDGKSKTWSINSKTFKMSKMLLDEKEIPFQMINQNQLGD